MTSKKWKTISGEPIDDIVQFVTAATRHGQVVHVGTDSLQTGRYSQFCTVIAILNTPHGGRCAYKREILPRISSLRERLLREVWLSVELAMLLTPNVPGELTVHVDANPNERHMSSRYVQELVGMVVSQGFAVRIKPDAWCATHSADHIVRHKGLLPNGARRRALLKVSDVA